MGEPAFDAESLFDDDYLYFYADRLSDARSDAETDLIWNVLDLSPGMRVLDLACGHGRIANRLAARGCTLTGIDVTPQFIDLAQKDAKAAGLDVEYVEGDMRDLPWSGHFDRVVNWFTAFGYFDDDGNRQALAEVARVLKPGGRVAFDLNSRDALIRDFQPATVIQRGEDIMVDRHQFDPLTSRLVSERIIVRNGRTRRIPYFVRIFTFTELRDWLLTAGFSQVEGYGGDGAPLGASSRRLVVVAER